MVEATGIEPASASHSTASSTYLARSFDLAECTPTGKLARSESPWI